MADASATSTSHPLDPTGVLDEPDSPTTGDGLVDLGGGEQPLFSDTADEPPSLLDGPVLDAGLTPPLVPDGGPAMAASVRVEQHPEPDQGMDKDLIFNARAKIISDFPDGFFVRTYLLCPAMRSTSF